MKLEKYNIRASDSLMEFEFVSSGVKGDILKIVQYNPTGVLNVYNLAFGDKSPDTGDFSDSVVSDNGDSQKVLATVAQTALTFLKANPEAMIFAKGLTVTRTRLYQRGIATNIDEISQILDIKGFVNGAWEPFKKGVNYEAFMVNKKG